MRNIDVVVIGGGPAGSAAAHRLTVSGAQVVVLDKEAFPRPKLCAGWITPEVVADLGLEVDRYPHSLHIFDRIHVNMQWVRRAFADIQYSIRRLEFDKWLLDRSGAEVIRHEVREIVRDGQDFVIDGEYRCRNVIGAGGTSCPVRRILFEEAPRARALQTVTLELEFPCEWKDPDCHLWFLDYGLPGYSWYVPKQRGWLNVGVGGMAARLKSRGESIWPHWQHLSARLNRLFGIRTPRDPTGYSFYVRGRQEPGRVGNAYLTGDSLGLATRDLCEGIGPAIRSGQRAANSIVTGAAYELADVASNSLGPGMVSRALDWYLTRGA